MYMNINTCIECNLTNAPVTNIIVLHKASFEGVEKAKELMKKLIKENKFEPINIIATDAPKLVNYCNGSLIKFVPALPDMKFLNEDICAYDFIYVDLLLSKMKKDKILSRCKGESYKDKSKIIYY